MPQPAVRLQSAMCRRSWNGSSAKALEKDRNLRYQNAAEMRTDLQRLKRDTEIGHGLSAAESGTVVGAQESGELRSSGLPRRGCPSTNIRGRLCFASDSSHAARAAFRVMGELGQLGYIVARLSCRCLIAAGLYYRSGNTLPTPDRERHHRPRRLHQQHRRSGF